MDNKNRRKAPQVWTFDGDELAESVAEKLQPNIIKYFYDAHKKLKRDDDRPLTYFETCEYLKVSKTTLGKWVSDGLIPYTCVDPENPKSKRFFQKKDLLEFLDKHKSLTREEIRRGASNG